MNEEEKQAPQSPEEIETPGEEKSNSPAPLGGRSVFAYLAVLFGAAFLLLLFAYLMQQRDSAEIMGNLSQLRESMGSIQSIDELTEENRQLREELEKRKETEEELRGQVDALDTERQTQNSNIQDLTGKLEEQENTRNAWTGAVLYLEQMEYLVETDQLDAIINPFGGMDAVKETLTQIDKEIGRSYPEGWPTLTERCQAVIEAIEKDG